MMRKHCFVCDKMREAGSMFHTEGLRDSVGTVVIPGKCSLFICEECLFGILTRA